MGVLRDGGNFKSAQVSKEGKLQTLATMLPHIAHHSRDPHHETAFVLYTRHTIQAVDTEENASYFQYTGSDFCVLNQLVVSTDADDMKIELFFDSEYTSGGIDKSPLNLNRNSSKSIDHISKDTNNGATPLVMTNDQNKEFNDISLTASMRTYTIDFEDAIYMRKNSTLGIVVKSSQTGKTFRSSLYFFEDELE